jgi:hypothetical protein
MHVIFDVEIYHKHAYTFCTKYFFHILKTTNVASRRCEILRLYLKFLTNWEIVGMELLCM